MTKENANVIVRSEWAGIKCIVWDLDNTLWEGVLLEGGEVVPREEVVEIIKTLDRRGILNSVASKNEFEPAISQLEKFGLSEYFIYPQVNWGSKADSIEKIAESINIRLDAIGFVDDQSFERDEVAYSHPMVRCYDAALLEGFLERPEMNPRFVTPESSLRRSMYQSDIERNRAEESFAGPNEDFLRSLGMSFTISRTDEEDLQRVEELTLRTNQLNTTGYSYSYEELLALCDSPNHLFWVTSLDDCYGSYGKIGLALVEKGEGIWVIKLLLMSCRVMSRGVGMVLMNYIIREAKRNGVKLKAEFVPNDRNRMMFMAYRFAGFESAKTVGDVTIMEYTSDREEGFPDYLNVHID